MMIDAVIERLARALVARRLSRQEKAERRREARWARKESQEVLEQAYEAAHAPERLEIAQWLLQWARNFPATPEGSWLLKTYHGQWGLGCGLYVDSQGRLWRAGERHWFGGTPDREIVDPQRLAAMLTTAQLRAIRDVAVGSQWRQVLWRELWSLAGGRWLP